jgi:hypothetical protein
MAPVWVSTAASPSRNRFQRKAAAERNPTTGTLVEVVVAAMDWMEPKRTTRRLPPAGTNLNVCPSRSTGCRNFAAPIASCPGRCVGMNQSDDDADDVVVVVVDDVGHGDVVNETIYRLVVAAPVDDRRKKAD